eukprot:scaffold834_cov123-Cylindrotheca_fusiformis.AAC.10
MSGDDDKSRGVDSSEDPTDLMMEQKKQEKYVALRNHKIRFEDAIDLEAEHVYELGKWDVVFGRGRRYQNHLGNRRLRDIIERYKTRYHSLDRSGKRKLVEMVYQEVSDGGSRFLKKLDDKDIWIVVDRPIALQKVSHTMRCRKSIIKKLDKDGNVPVAVGGPQLSETQTINTWASNGGSSGRPLVETARAPHLMSMLPLHAAHYSIANLEAQFLVAGGQCRGLSQVVSSAMGYQEMLRRDQLIRGMMMSQQMVGALAPHSGSIPANQKLVSSTAFCPGSAPTDSPANSISR